MSATTLVTPQMIERLAAASTLGPDGQLPQIPANIIGHQDITTAPEMISLANSLTDIHHIHPESRAGDLRTSCGMRMGPRDKVIPDTPRRGHRPVVECRGCLKIETALVLGQPLRL